MIDTWQGQSRSDSSVLHVLQITDFHLFPDAEGTMLGIRTDESLRAVLRRAMTNHWPADLVLVTGDMAQEPKPETYRRLAGYLNALGAPCHCLPGNHDDPALLRTVLAGERISDEPSVILGPWQIILLDSTISNDPGGFLRQDQLELLESLLAARPDQFALVCMHHSPVETGSAWLDTMRLRNAEALFEVLRPHRQVKGLVFGHVHQTVETELDGIRVLACPSTGFQFKPGSADFALDAIAPGYRWLRLYPDGRIETGVERLEVLPQGLDMASEGY